MKWSISIQDLKGGQFLQSAFYGIERGDYFLGVGVPCLCLFLPFPSPPPPSDVFPAQMEGVKLVVNKVLSSHFQVLPLLWPLLTIPPCLSLDPLLLSQAIWDK